MEPGSLAPGTETFLLTVRVVSIEDGTAIAGATVSAGVAVGNRTSASTGTDGLATLELAAPQVIGLQVGAPGHADATTAGIKLGAVANAQAGPCLFCAVDATDALAGAAGRATLRLVPQPALRELDIPLSASASPPTQESVLTVPVAYSSDPAISEIFQRHVARVEGVLTWTNAPGAAADLEFGLACAQGPSLSRTNGGGPQTLATMGERRLALAVDVPEGCGPLAVEVMVRSVTTDITPHAALTLTSIPALQRPLFG